MYAPDPDEKFDFQNVDVKLYLALKAMVPHWASMSEQEATEGGIKYVRAEDDLLMNAERALYEFSQSFGPIPDWAVDRNFGYELVAGAQLCTRDGRKTGNAHIVSIEQKDFPHLAHNQNPYGEITVYNCLTDAGSKFVFTEQELETCFTIGDWISDPARIIKDLDRNGEFQEQRL